MSYGEVAFDTPFDNHANEWSWLPSPREGNFAAPGAPTAVVVAMDGYDVSRRVLVPITVLFAPFADRPGRRSNPLATGRCAGVLGPASF